MKSKLFLFCARNKKAQKKKTHTHTNICWNKERIELYLYKTVLNLFNYFFCEICFDICLLLYRLPSSF